MMEVRPVADALPAMQALASRVWSPEARHHPGQLAWSAAYALPQDLDHGPVASIDGTAWAWAEADDWLEICVDPARPDQVAPLVGWFLGRASGPVSTMVLETEGHVLRGLLEHGFESWTDPGSPTTPSTWPGCRARTSLTATPCGPSSRGSTSRDPPSTALPGRRRRRSQRTPTAADAHAAVPRRAGLGRRRQGRRDGGVLPGLAGPPSPGSRWSSPSAASRSTAAEDSPDRCRSRRLPRPGRPAPGPVSCAHGGRGPSGPAAGLPLDRVRPRATDAHADPPGLSRDASAAARTSTSPGGLAIPSRCLSRQHHPIWVATTSGPKTP